MLVDILKVGGGRRKKEEERRGATVRRRTMREFMRRFRR